jgi:hypothetical protein
MSALLPVPSRHPLVHWIDAMEPMMRTMSTKPRTAFAMSAGFRAMYCHLEME